MTVFVREVLLFFVSDFGSGVFALNPNNAFETTDVNNSKKKKIFKILVFLYVFKFGRRLLAKSFSLKWAQRFTMGKGVNY